jgi:hypothetical protein
MRFIQSTMTSIYPFTPFVLDQTGFVYIGRQEVNIPRVSTSITFDQPVLASETPSLESSAAANT